MAFEVIKVLLIEDNPGDARLIQELLKESLNIQYDITHLTNIRDLRKYITKDYDIALLDLNYDDIGGLKSFQLASRYLVGTPIIVLTGQNDEELGYEIVKRGAQDYLIKGEIDSKNLRRSIRYSIERKSSQSNLRIARGKNRILKNEAALLKEESDRLREINKTKDEFISLASHQLRTPATIVKQYLAMLMGNYVGELTADQKDYVQKAYESNDKQLHIVEDILAVARLDGANNATVLTDCDIKPILVNALETVHGQLRHKRQNLLIDMPEQPIAGRVDPTQLSMVLENIIENASHYSDEGTQIKLNVSTSKKWIEIEVADEGVGIEEKDISKLFQKFSRIANPYSVQVGGTGLGLYWANKVVRYHNGRIGVSSKLGIGTTFKIQLPLQAPLGA
jgi:signal transduction histidine kinase